MREFTRDPAHWLYRFTPDEWIRAALSEVKRAEDAYVRGNARAGASGVKRAAGMALNAALIVEPDPRWGRSYVEHVQGLSRDLEVPQAVRSACLAVLGAGAPGGEVIVLRTPRYGEQQTDAVKDVIAHAWAVVRRHENVDG